MLHKLVKLIPFEIGPMIDIKRKVSKTFTLGPFGISKCLGSDV